jgi:hypothetical protein
MRLWEIVNTYEFKELAKEIPPPFPFEEVLFAMIVCAIVVFPFKLAIPIAPPFDLQ